MEPGRGCLVTTSSSPSCSDPIEGVLRWARERYAIEDAVVLDRTPLDGGVSGVSVERIAVRIGGTEAGAAGASVAVVVKRASRREIDALTLLAGLDEPAIPRLLASGRDADGDWMAIPWFPGTPLGLTTEAPAAVGELMARVHARFLDTPSRWPSTLTRIDSAYVTHALTDFLPGTLEALPPVAGVTELRSRALSAAERLLADRAFRAAAESFPTTVLHGDLYGMNVLRDPSGAVLVIDWTGRIGPATFDIAMGTSSIASPAYLAYLAERTRIGGTQPQLAREYDWSRTLVSTMYAGAVAGRGSVLDGLEMLQIADAAYARFTG